MASTKIEAPRRVYALAGPHRNQTSPLNSRDSQRRDATRSISPQLVQSSPFDRRLGRQQSAENTTESGQLEYHKFQYPQDLPCIENPIFGPGHKQSGMHSSRGVCSTNTAVLPSKHLPRTAPPQPQAPSHKRPFTATEKASTTTTVSDSAYTVCNPQRKSKHTFRTPPIQQYCSPPHKETVLISVQQ